MKRLTVIFTGLLLAFFLTAPALAADNQAKPQSESQTKANRDVEGWMKSAKFIVGCYNVEDMVQIPGTRWIVGSGVITGGPGMNDRFILKDYLHVFDAKTETGGRVEPNEIAIKPDRARYPETTTPPDWETFGPHGIGLGTRKGKVITL